LSDELQLDAIINWVFSTYNILIVVRPVVGTERYLANAMLKRDQKKPLAATGLYSHSSFHMDLEPEIMGAHAVPATEALFETPSEAKFDALRRIYPHLKFRGNADTLKKTSQKKTPRNA
jgi:hypothetical protein